MTKLPEPVIIAATAEFLARRVILALAENMPADAVDKALEAHWVDRGNSQSRMRVQIDFHRACADALEAQAAQLEAFMEAAKMTRDDEKEGSVVFGAGHCVSKRSWNALMSALRNTEGEKNGE